MHCFPLFVHGALNATWVLGSSMTMWPLDIHAIFYVPLLLGPDRLFVPVGVPAFSAAMGNECVPPVVGLDHR